MANGKRVSPVRAAWLGGALVSLGACTAGPRTPPPSAEIDETGYRDAVRVLASDDFEGRAPGTPGEDKTVAYLVGQFRKLGLKPGNGDSYLQSVPMALIRARSDAARRLRCNGAALRSSAMASLPLNTSGTTMPASTFTAGRLS